MRVIFNLRLFESIKPNMIFKNDKTFIFRKKAMPLLTPSNWIKRLKTLITIGAKIILFLSVFAFFAIPFLTPREEIEVQLEIKEICGTPG